MSALIIALSPIITSAITGVLKGWAPFSNLSDQARTPIVRMLAAFIALVYVVLGMWITGSITPDGAADAVNAFIFALIAWLGSLGVFHLVSSKSPATPSS